MGGEPNSLKWSARMQIVKAVLQGLTWGPSGEFASKSALVNLRDPSPGKEHLLHPVIVALGSELVQPREGTSMIWGGAGSWIPAQLTPLPRAGGLTNLHWEMLEYSFKTYFPEVLTNQKLPRDSKILTASSLLNARNTSSLLVFPGDDVAVMYEHKTAYCTITKLVVVELLGCLYLWIFPHWYEHQLANGRQRSHPVRQTVLLKRCEMKEGSICAPIPCSSIVQQVLITHSCNRITGSISACRVRPFCSEHDEADCSAAQCQAAIMHLRDWHSHTNPIYEVLDRAAGFTTANR